MLRHRLLAFSVLVVALSCDDARHPTGTLDPRGPSKIIQDGAHGGNANFFFLPPMVRLPDEPDGFEFNDRLQPALSVDICELTTDYPDPETGRPTIDTPCLNPQNPLKRFGPGTVSLETSPRTNFGWWSFFNLPEDGFYYVLWNTKESNLDVSKYYRITVRLEGVPGALGIADVDPMRNLTQWQNSLTGEVVQLVDNIILPIPFRIGQAALCEGTESCTSATFSKDATTTQVLQLEGEGGGAIAAVSVPPGALPADGPQYVTFNIGRVDIGSTALLSNVSAQEGGQTLCHPDLTLQQFEGCFKITTTPELALNENGEMFDLDITVAACFELYGTEDPREEFVQLWSSDVDEAPRPLPSADASQLLGADAADCGENIVTVASSNAFIRVASAGLRKLQSGLGQIFGVKTAYAVDVGLGGLTKLLSNIGPAMTAEIQRYTDTDLNLGAGATTTATARIVGTRTHSHGSALSVGIGGVPVTYTLASGHGELRLIGSEGPGSSTLTIMTNTNPIDGSPVSGGGFAPINWTMPSPTEAGTYTFTLTATGPALGGPVTFSASVTVAPQSLPDFIISAPTTLTLSAGMLPTTGGGILLSPFTVTNQGGDFAHWINNGFYVSDDPEITADDLRIGINGTPTGSLGAGASFNFGLSPVMIPRLSPGVHYVGILVDLANSVAETNESNNYISSPITVSDFNSFELYPNGSSVCNGAAACPVTNEFAIRSVVFSFTPLSGGAASPSLCRPTHAPVGETPNYGVSPPSSNCTGWQNGSVKMTFSPRPRTVSFRLEGNNQGAVPFPVSAEDWLGNPLPVTVGAVSTHVDQFGNTMRREMRVVSSPNDVANVTVNSGSFVLIIDNLTITPVPPLQ